MPISVRAISLRWTIGALTPVALGMDFILYVTLTLPDGQLLGVFLFAFGAVQVLLYKRTARKYYAKAQSDRPLVARFWTQIEPRGTELFLLGVGIIIALAGCILLVAGRS